MKKKNEAHLNFWAPAALAEKLDEAAAERGLAVSAVIRETLIGAFRGKESSSERVRGLTGGGGCGDADDRKRA